MSGVQAIKITQLGSIRQQQIFNRLNALHYQGASMLVCLQHNSHKNLLFFKTFPHPVSNEELTAKWSDDTILPANLTAYNLTKIILASGKDTYEFEPVEYQITEALLTCTIPDHAVQSGIRSQQRFVCADRDISVTLTQHAIVYKGRLLNFSASGMMVDLVCDDDSTFNWLNLDINATLSIMLAESPVYTGDVKVLDRGNGQYLLIPNLEPTPRYASKRYRARRQQFVPSPDFIFDHPITGKRRFLKIEDIGSLGLSVIQERYMASLIPGLLIKNAKISFSNNFSVTCTVQVVYYQDADESPETTRIGLAILHINVADHLTLINMVQQAKDPRAYVSNQVDPEDLFEFFFETGFIYPKKYAEIAGRRDEVALAYKALYETGVDISRHFVYQNAGLVTGHFSSLRVYRKTWLCQHHAALKGQQAGLKVIRAISEYTNDSYQLNPTHIEYIIGYYQVSNRFPRKYFGNFVEYLKDPQKTCLDRYTYINEAKKFLGGPVALEEGWVLEKATPADLVEFYGYYNSVSDGMLPEALDLLPDTYDDKGLAETYEVNGLVRSRDLYVLRFGKNPIALIDIQSADFGLNLSEITNASTVYMIDPDPAHYEKVRFSIYKLAAQSDKLTDPVMVYPSDYLSDCGMKVEKEYTMWTLNIPRGVDEYMDWMSRFCR